MLTGLVVVRWGLPCSGNSAGPSPRYAEDALDWWHRRTGANATLRAHETTALAAWRDANPHDTVCIIRAIRAREVA